MATMSQQEEENGSGFQDLLDCMICFEPLRGPKMLQCGHTFCEQCLKQYINTQTRKPPSDRRRLSCPTCRDITILPSSGVTGLPHDFKVSKFKEMLQRVSVKNDDAGCDFCKLQNKQSNKAEFHCTRCYKNFCLACVDKHDKNPLFKNHETIDITKGKSQLLFCLEHKEPISYFCRECRLLQCSLCVMAHEQTHSMTDIQDAHSLHKDRVEELLTSLNNRLQDTHTFKDQILSTKVTKETHFDQLRNVIKETTLAMIEQLKTSEKTLLLELHERQKAEMKQIELELEGVNFHLGNIESLCGYASEMLQGSYPMQVLAIYEDLSSRMQTEIDTDLGEIPEDVVTTAKFQPTSQFAHVGELVSAKLSVNPSPGMSMEENCITAHIGLKAIFRVDIHGKQSGEVWLPRDVAFLPNGNLVVADTGNARLQIFDKTGKSVKIIQPENFKPLGVATTKKHIIASDGKENCIKLFNFEGKCEAVWCKGWFKEPCGVAGLPDNNIIVTDHKKHTVTIYGPKTTNWHIRHFGSKGTSDENFNCPFYVAINKDGNIIVSDCGNNCVKVYNGTGKYLLKFGTVGSDDGQLKEPRGVCVDGEGNIIVADWCNHRVSMFSAKGVFLRHLLTEKDGVKYPWGVAMSPLKYLAVTESTYSMHAAVNVYKLDT